MTFSPIRTIDWTRISPLSFPCGAATCWSIRGTTVGPMFSSISCAGVTVLWRPAEVANQRVEIRRIFVASASGCGSLFGDLRAGRLQVWVVGKTAGRAPVRICHAARAGRRPTDWTARTFAGTAWRASGDTADRTARPHRRTRPASWVRSAGATLPRGRPRRAEGRREQPMWHRQQRAWPQGDADPLSPQAARAHSLRQTGPESGPRSVSSQGPFAAGLRDSGPTRRAGVDHHFGTDVPNRTVGIGGNRRPALTLS